MYKVVADGIQITSKKIVYSVIPRIQSLFNVNKLINLWKIPWMEEPGRLQSMGLLGVGHN